MNKFETVTKLMILYLEQRDKMPDEEKEIILKTLEMFMVSENIQ